MPQATPLLPSIRGVVPTLTHTPCSLQAAPVPADVIERGQRNTAYYWGVLFDVVARGPDVPLSQVTTLGQLANWIALIVTIHAPPPPPSLASHPYNAETEKNTRVTADLK